MGDVPEARDEHTSTFFGDTMILFGGFCQGTRKNDILAYNFRERSWTEIIPDSIVAP